MSHDYQLPPEPPSAANDRANMVLTLCLIWVMASVLGFAVQAFASTPSGLRGSQATNAAIAKQVLKQRPARSTSNSRSSAHTSTPQMWLTGGVWRAGPCDSAQNFQTFVFVPAPKVEVGSGKPGEGEKLELLRVARVEGELIQVETRVCAPVGCNQTVERYKVLGVNQMQEWHFEGRLPDHPPYILVANGAALDGTGAGRIFNRCAA